MAPKAADTPEVCAATLFQRKLPAALCAVRDGSFFSQPLQPARQAL